MRRGTIACGLLIAAGCGPSAGSEAGDASTAAESAEAESSGAPTGGVSVPVWTVDVPACGELYGLVLVDEEVVAVGTRTDEGTRQAWAVRYSATGEEVWSVTYPLVGALAAVVTIDAEEALAVGYRDEPYEPVLLRLGLGDGAALWERAGEPAEGGLFGAAWSGARQTLWATGVAGSDFLTAQYDPDGGLAATFAGPTGGFSGAVGYAAAMAGEDAVICGRSSTGEGGQLWLGRYSHAGELLWSAEGPDPGVGAFSDCWDVATAPDGSAVTVEAGYAGARVALVDAAGTQVWEFAEANAGAQAVDVVGTSVVVAGWSASMEESPMPLRSHSSGERHGWIRRFTTSGEGPSHTWIGVDRLSPRDIKVHPAGGVVVVGQRIPADTCGTPWLGRVEG